MRPIIRLHFILLAVFLTTPFLSPINAFPKEEISFDQAEYIVNENIGTLQIIVKKTTLYAFNFQESFMISVTTPTSQNEDFIQLNPTLTYNFFDGRYAIIEKPINLTIIDDEEDETADEEIWLEITELKNGEYGTPKQTKIIIKANQAPTAALSNTDPDIVIWDQDGVSGESISLNASASSDPDGSIRSYEYIIPGLTNSNGVNSPNPIFSYANAPQGIYSGTLIVYDDDGRPSAPLPISISINDTPKAVNRTANIQTIDHDNDNSAEVEVNGSLSEDLVGGIINYHWTTDTGLDFDTPNPIATMAFPVGTHFLTLTVQDKFNITHTDSVLTKVTIVSADNEPPKAVADVSESGEVAGEGKYIYLPYTSGDGSLSIRLDGSRSTDDGSIVSYQWRQGLSLIANTAVKIWPQSIGVQMYTLIVTDDQGVTGTDSKVVSVYPASQVTPPTANAGKEQKLIDEDGDGLMAVKLDGSASSGNDGGSIIDYKWYLDSDPETPLSMGEEPSPTITLGLGVHSVVLEVTDNAGRTDEDTVIIALSPKPNPGQFQFKVRHQSVSEQAGTVTLTIERLEGTSGTVLVHYATHDEYLPAGSLTPDYAKPAEDYTPISGTLEFLTGQSEKTIQLAIRDDELSEGIEKIELQLSYSIEPEDITKAHSTIFINDNDAPLQVHLVENPINDIDFDHQIYTAKIRGHGHTTANIYNSQGHVRRILDATLKNSEVDLKWDGRNTDGDRVVGDHYKCYVTQGDTRVLTLDIVVSD